LTGVSSVLPTSDSTPLLHSYCEDLRGLLLPARHEVALIFDLERDPLTGVRRQELVTVKGAKHEAERTIAAITRSLEAGEYTEPSKITLGEFLTMWMDQYVATNVRPWTREGYRTIV